MTFYDDDEHQDGGGDARAGTTSRRRPVSRSAVAPRRRPRAARRGGRRRRVEPHPADPARRGGHGAAPRSAPCGVWVQRQIDPSGLAGRGPHHHRSRGRHLVGDRRPPGRRGHHRQRVRVGLVPALNGGGPFQAGDYELAEDSSMGDVVRHPGPRPRAARGAPLHDARGLHVQETLARLADPEKGLGFDLGHAPAAPRQRPGALGVTSRRTRPRTRASSSPRPTRSTPRPTRRAGAAADGGRARRHDGRARGGDRPGALQPHALRDPHRRLADRGGDEGPRGAGRRSPG